MKKIHPKLVLIEGKIWRKVDGKDKFAQSFYDPIIAN